jgi:hypothetical protein
LNKGTGFSHQEREDLGLHGLLPHEVNSMEQQALRVYELIHRVALATLSESSNQAPRMPS